MNIKKAVLVAAMAGTVLGAAGCAKKAAEVTVGSDLPDWVLMPTIKDGIAASSCVKFSGIMDVDRKQAVANARADLAQQINVKVKAMDETYSRKTDTAGDTSTGGVFESVSQQVTEQSLNGARPTKVDFVEINGVKNLCAMVTLEPEKTQELFKNLLTAADAQLSAQDERVLYEEFKAHQARERLEKATGG